jgi:hypothetical protein
MNFRTMSRNVRYYLGKNLPFLDEAAQPVMFFPADSLAARSFSEYPFFVEVLPESMILNAAVG